MKVKLVVPIEVVTEILGCHASEMPIDPSFQAAVKRVDMLYMKTTFCPFS